MCQESVFGSGLSLPMMELLRCIATILSAATEKITTLPLLVLGTLALGDLASAKNAEKAGRPDQNHLLIEINKIDFS